MLINDRVFGEVKITEPVIVDLLVSPELERLKKIDQAGYFEPYFPNSKRSRFEHSFNNYLLLKKFGACIEEQIAGLIHDVSHTAFSHSVDYVLNEKRAHHQEHQDNIFNNYVKRTTIPNILQNYNFDIQYILNEKNFPLQEKDSPALCADRLSYSFIDSVGFGEIDSKKAVEMIDQLIVVDNLWVFKSLEAAREYAELFSKINRVYYSGLESGAMFRGLSDYLKYAIENKYIGEEDLYTDDEYVVNKINKNLEIDEKLKEYWYRVDNTDWFVEDDENYDFTIKCKSRAVDPAVLVVNKIKNLSELQSDWQDRFTKEMKPREYFLKFVQ